MKRIAVCGGSGFIGAALVRELSKNPANAIMWSMSREHCDLRLPMHCEQFVRRADVVYMCAGVTGGSGLIASDPLSLVTPNVLMHLHLFDACKRAGVKKVICLSSTTGYPDTDLPMSEEDYFLGELHPAYFNPGNARRFIERLGAMYPELNIVFLRPSVVYGPGDNFDPETSHVIPSLVRKVAERQNPITIWGDGTNWRDGVYIDDMVRALLLAADAPAGAYNIASGEGMTVTEMWKVLVLHANNFIAHPPIFDTSKPAMLKKRVLAIDKARRVMGWEPKIPMPYGLKLTLDVYAKSL